MVGADELNFKYFEFELTIEHLSIDTPFALRMVEVELKRKIKTGFLENENFAIFTIVTSGPK